MNLKPKKEKSPSTTNTSSASKHGALCLNDRKMNQLKLQQDDGKNIVKAKYEGAESLLDDIHAKLFEANCGYETAVYDLMQRKQLLEAIAVQFEDCLRIYQELRSSVVTGDSDVA